MSSYTYIEHTDPFPSKKIKAYKKTKTEILIASWKKLVKGLLENIYSTSRKYYKINSRKGSDNWSVLRHSAGFWSTKSVRMDMHLISFFVILPCFCEALLSSVSQS